MELLTDLLAIKVWGAKVFDDDDFAELMIRFLFNFGVAIWMTRFIYYPTTRNKDYLFTYVLFSVIVFLVCHLLANVGVDMGFALGLFAVFGIIRYRTDAIPIKEMTYLFLIMGLAVINGLANKKVSIMEVVITNLIVVGVTYLLEKVWLVNKEIGKTITYEKIENIKPEKHPALHADLEERTGLKIERFTIGKVDFLRDVAMIKIFYLPEHNEGAVFSEDGPGENNSSS